MSSKWFEMYSPYCQAYMSSETCWTPHVLHQNRHFAYSPADGFFQCVWISGTSIRLSCWTSPRGQSAARARRQGETCTNWNLLDFSGGSLLPVCYGNILVNDSCWVRYADMRITDCGDNMHVCNLLVCVYFCGTADYVCRCITDWMHVWMGCTHVWMYVPDYTASECILTSTHQLIFRESVAGISQ